MYLRTLSTHIFAEDIKKECTNVFRLPSLSMELQIFDFVRKTSLFKTMVILGNDTSITFAWPFRSYRSHIHNCKQTIPTTSIRMTVFSSHTVGSQTFPNNSSILITNLSARRSIRTSIYHKTSSTHILASSSRARVLASCTSSTTKHYQAQCPNNDIHQRTDRSMLAHVICVYIMMSQHVRFAYMQINRELVTCVSLFCYILRTSKWNVRVNTRTVHISFERSEMDPAEFSTYHRVYRHTIAFALIVIHRRRRNILYFSSSVCMRCGVLVIVCRWTYTWALCVQCKRMRSRILIW